MQKHDAMPHSRFELPFILLVEDDENDAFGMELAFTKIKLSERVRRVCDGASAIEYLEGKGQYSARSEYPLPSVVLVDLHMPRMDGFEVLRWIRQHPNFQHLVVVVLTSSEDDGHIRKALGLGANSYLIKPKTFAEFTNMLESLEAFWKMHQRPNANGGVKKSSPPT